MTGKQKVIIVNNNLAIGGVQKSLINLLYEIKNEYEVTLFLFSSSGEYKNSIPKEIKIIEANRFLKLLGISQGESRKMGLPLYLLRGILAMWSKIFSNRLPIAFLISTEKKLLRYDVAISYLHNAKDKAFYGGCNEFVLRKTIADKKIAFVHCDFIEYGGNSQYARKIYSKFDNIAAVSQGCLNKFNYATPEITSKRFIVTNCHNYNEIMELSASNIIDYDKRFINIITVARLNSEKGIERGIEAISRCVNNGYKLRYHIIGDGVQYDKLRNLSQIKGIEEYVAFYGNQVNPYRYMKDADLFLLPSYHEAAPMVFNEAKCLGLPILATKTTSTQELVIDSKAGWVCENSTEGIESTLKYIVSNRSELEGVRGFLANQDYDNDVAIRQFNNMLNEVIVND